MAADVRWTASTQRVLRSIDDPNEVFIYLEFSTLEEANEARARLVASGVLDQFEEAWLNRLDRRRLAPTSPGERSRMTPARDPLRRGQILGRGTSVQERGLCGEVSFPGGGDG